jgi:hypothetical protein
VLPLAPVADRVALIGPLADDSSGMLGCYTFPSHVRAHHPDVPIGVDVPTLAAALRDDLGSERIVIEAASRRPTCTRRWVDAPMSARSIRRRCTRSVTG